MCNQIDCPEFLQLLSIRVPVYSARENPVFYLPFLSTKVEIDSSLYAICNEINNFLKCAPPDIDILNSPLSLILKEISSLIYFINLSGKFSIFSIFTTA